MCSPTMVSLKSTHNAGEADVRASKKSRKGEYQPFSPRHGTNVSSSSENNARMYTKFPSCVRNTPVSTAGDIRNRFLHRLGIQKVTPGRPTTCLSCQPKPPILKVGWHRWSVGCIGTHQNPAHIFLSLSRRYPPRRPLSLLPLAQEEEDQFNTLESSNMNG